LPHRDPIRTVVADDDQAFAHNLATLLEDDGRFEVVGVAANGEQAVQLGIWHEPDVVVMDIRMPVIDGIEATRLLRRSRRRACVLMMSGDRADRSQEALDAGAADVVHKRTFGAEMVEAIADVGERSRAGRRR
jgi:DNA-binding NarL/FixJ family response regulator